MRDEAGTRVRIKIKGNKEARRRMIKLMDVLEKEGVEVSLEISSSCAQEKKSDRK